MKNNYWLIKEEPAKYSYNDLVNDKKTVWDGVGNNLALKHIRKILKGDDLTAIDFNHIVPSNDILSP